VTASEQLPGAAPVTHPNSVQDCRCSSIGKRISARHQVMLARFQAVAACAVCRRMKVEREAPSCRGGNFSPCASKRLPAANMSRWP